MPTQSVCQACHETFNTYPSRIKRGDAKFCSRQCKDSSKRVVHGHTKVHWHSPTYSTWSSMIQRCLNPKSVKYLSYGAKGITVCDRWRDFANFLEDMGPRPDGKTLDRFPNQSGNYEPENCRWATLIEQQQNTKANHWIELRGQRKCLTEWSRYVGVNQTTISHRLKDGWPIEEAIFTPASRLNRGRIKKVSLCLPPSL